MGLIALVFLLSCGGTPDTTHLEKEVLHPETKIALAGVDGRIDHLTYDPAGHRVFVAALGNNTVEVVDLATQARIHTMTGLHEPQGVCYIPASGRLAVANGDNGVCMFYDGKDYSEVGSIPLGGDADNVRYDGRRLYVGYGGGAIALIDPMMMKPVGDMALTGHPESFQLDDSGRIYINVPDENEIVVGDLIGPRGGAGNSGVTARWKNKGASANFPMALDARDGHLFVVYRHPAQLRMLDCHTGALLSSTPCVGDADDVFYDAGTGFVMVTGGEGYIDVFRGGTLINHIATRKGARTSLWLPDRHKLVVAVPARGGEPAALWVYGL